jgi:hypothetical protein
VANKNSISLLWVSGIDRINNIPHSEIPAPLFPFLGFDNLVVTVDVDVKMANFYAINGLINPCHTAFFKGFGQRETVVVKQHRLARIKKFARIKCQLSRVSTPTKDCCKSNAESVLGGP